MKARILLVDDDKKALENCISVIGAEARQYEHYLTPESALAEIKANPFSIAVVFLDQIFYNKEREVEYLGSNYIQAIKEINSLIEVIMLSGDRSEDTFNEWISKKADNHIFKDEHSWSYLKVLASQAVDNFDKNYSCSLEKRVSKFKTPDAIRKVGMVGVSFELEQACNKIIDVSKTEHSVLLIGETGTGKELSATAIHKLSGKQGKIVSINCGLYSGVDSNLEAELFGTEKGRFTGVDSKPGLIEEASGGTLFLDEVHCLPRKVQEKLLRFLNDGTFRRVGGVRDLNSKCRIICAANSQLSEKIKTGEILKDFYFRIRHVIVEIPSLRDRKDDIEPLCWHFLHKHKNKDKSEHLKLSDNALKFIKKQSWPANVRDLDSLFRSITTFVSEPIITSEHIKKYAELENESIEVETYNKQKARHDHETRLLFIKSWEEAQGSPTEAAKLIGISRQLWMTKRKSLGLEQALPIKKKGQGITTEQSEMAKNLFKTIKSKFVGSDRKVYSEKSGVR